MANKALFQSLPPGGLSPAVDTVNEAGGTAYDFAPAHKLAQYAVTGCMNSTFYASAKTQLDTILKLTDTVSPEFIAQTAIFARQQGYMKDLPALLTAVLAARDISLFKAVFSKVIDNAKMLRNFVQIVRSGVTGRKSFGHVPRAMIRNWFETQSSQQLLNGSVGNDPSLADIIKMVHPHPRYVDRGALYAYLLHGIDGLRKRFEHRYEELPDIVKDFECFKVGGGEGEKIPNVEFRLLTGLPLPDRVWKQIARTAPWHMTRMNLNTFLRHGVFEDAELTQLIADRLRSRELIERARMFPYQLMVAYYNADGGIPLTVRNALQDAMEIALDNVPEIPGQVYVFPDVSGSMHSAITGFRAGSTSKVRCVDVAALVAAALVRKNQQTQVIPFEFDVVDVDLNPRDTVMTNARRLSRIGGGGTNCSAPLRMLNQRRATGDVLIYVSDNESWLDSDCGRHGTATMHQWKTFKVRSPQAKLICIDLQPYGSTQAQEQQDIINVGGFSDQVFRLIGDVASGNYSVGHWVKEIESIDPRR